MFYTDVISFKLSFLLMPKETKNYTYKPIQSRQVVACLE